MKRSLPTRWHSVAAERSSESNPWLAIIFALLAPLALLRRYRRARGRWVEEPRR